MWRRLKRWWWMLVMDVASYGPDRLWLWAMTRAAEANDWGDEPPSQDPPF